MNDNTELNKTIVRKCLGITDDQLNGLENSVYFSKLLNQLNNLNTNENYLCIDYIGHINEFSFYHFDVLSDVEKYITGDSGLTNPFITSIIILKNNCILEYDYDKENNKVNWITKEEG